MAVKSDTQRTYELVKEVRIKATPETIFPFFTEPELMMQWKGLDVNIDPQPGGQYKCKMHEGFVAMGEYVTVEAPYRVAFTFGWEGGAIPPGSTTVDVTLTPDGDETVVRLTHTGLPDEQAVHDHGIGWTHYLDRLSIASTGGDPGPDTQPGEIANGRPADNN